jgi:hypothetical protein
LYERVTTILLRLSSSKKPALLDQDSRGECNSFTRLLSQQFISSQVQQPNDAIVDAQDELIGISGGKITS